MKLIESKLKMMWMYYRTPELLLNNNYRWLGTEYLLEAFADWLTEGAISKDSMFFVYEIAYQNKIKAKENGILSQDGARYVIESFKRETDRGNSPKYQIIYSRTFTVIDNAFNKDDNSLIDLFLKKYVTLPGERMYKEVAEYWLTSKHDALEDIYFIRRNKKWDEVVAEIEELDDKEM